MMVRPRGRAASGRGARDESRFEQIRLDDVFERFGIFGERRGDRGNARRSAAILFDQRAQKCAIEPIQAEFVDAFALQRLVGNLSR